MVFQGLFSPAVAKFCNTLSFAGEPTIMILTVGSGTEQVTFTAETGECVPATGHACTEIPSGPDVFLSLADADDPMTALNVQAAQIEAGQDWIFYTDIMDGEPVWNGSWVAPASGVTCEDITYDDI